MTMLRNQKKSKEQKPARPTKEEREQLLAQIKAEFDEARKDPAKWEKEQKDREFWNHLA